ncbi:Brp/Blh family beta-carotene 15,15'-dioxygenase [Algoriphagus mannitolivorans]|uniref:Brp/Blh family beta-carotene 15,15'-dioxygenase n=1 Tax=Algoriphagus mannitolivorans TaxID=226504 RepID=UPI00040CFF3E|nr:Brp/Blh family beta-carotene 15,15'-dioxygenase [Algoriphagus mannitolivorans]
MKSTENLLKVIGLAICLLFSLMPSYPQVLELTVIGIVLMTVGIPHGAIDHLTSKPNPSSKDLIFFLIRYLGMIGIYILLWILFPLLSLAFFLLFSAYHFGQSHFFERKNLIFTDYFLYLTRGSFFISVILLGDLEMTQSILNPLIDFQGIVPYAFYAMGIFLIVSLVLEWKSYRLIKKSTWVDLVFLAPLLFISPLMISFIVYFGFWHAFPSMKLEYQFLKAFPPYNSIKKFIYQLLPFSLISLIGIGLMVYFGQQYLESSELLLLFFILISLISFPHVIYMDRFVRIIKTDRYST